MKTITITTSNEKLQSMYGLFNEYTPKNRDELKRIVSFYTAAEETVLKFEAKARDLSSQGTAINNKLKNVNPKNKSGEKYTAELEALNKVFLDLHREEVSVDFDPECKEIFKIVLDASLETGIIKGFDKCESILSMWNAVADGLNIK